MILFIVNTIDFDNIIIVVINQYHYGNYNYVILYNLHKKDVGQSNDGQGLGPLIMVLVHRRLETKVGEKFVSIAHALLTRWRAPRLCKGTHTLIPLLSFYLVVKESHKGESSIRDIPYPAWPTWIGIFVNVETRKEHEDQDKGLRNYVGHLSAVKEAADHKTHRHGSRSWKRIKLVLLNHFN